MSTTTNSLENFKVEFCHQESVEELNELFERINLKKWFRESRQFFRELIASILLAKGVKNEKATNK